MKNHHVKVAAKARLQVQITQVLQCVVFHGDFWRLIMINHNFQIPVERGKT